MCVFVCVCMCVFVCVCVCVCACVCGWMGVCITAQPYSLPQYCSRNESLQICGRWCIYACLYPMYKVDVFSNTQ